MSLTNLAALIAPQVRATADIRGALTDEIVREIAQRYGYAPSPAVTKKVGHLISNYFV